MAKPIWQQNIQEKLDKTPLFFVRVGVQATHHVKHEGCLASGETKGKKVSLRDAVNYSCHTCDGCGKRVC